jgi:hypothetical protein
MKPWSMISGVLLALALFGLVNVADRMAALGCGEFRLPANSVVNQLVARLGVGLFCA